MHVIFKLRSSVTGPLLISADDVGASPQDGIGQQTGGDTLHHDSRRRVAMEYHMVMDRFISSNTAWCGIFAPCDVATYKTPRRNIEEQPSIHDVRIILQSDDCGQRRHQDYISGILQMGPSRKKQVAPSK